MFSGRKAVPTVAASGEAATGRDQEVFGAATFDDSEMNLIDVDELNFAEPEPDEISLPDAKTLLLGEVADFMQEVKILLRITKEADDTKENFLMLLRLLISKHRLLLPLMRQLLPPASWKMPRTCPFYWNRTKSNRNLLTHRLPKNKIIMKSQFISHKKQLAAKWWLLSVTLIAYQMLVNAADALAQDGNQGIQQATSLQKICDQQW